MKCNQSRPGFELMSPCPFPTTITITPRAPDDEHHMSWSSSPVLHVLFVLLGELLVGCVLWHISLCRLFNAESIFVLNNQFYFKQFILAWVHNLIVKNISISNYSVYSSSSSCYTASMDIPDPLSPLLPIGHHLWPVFKATSCILTQLLHVCSSWSSCFSSAICGGP